MSAKPTTTNARYRVVEHRYYLHSCSYALIDTEINEEVGRVFAWEDKGEYVWNLHDLFPLAPIVSRPVETAQAALDALVAAYEATLGSGEAGE